MSERTLTCERAREELVALHDGEVEEPLRSALRRHLGACVSCRASSESVQRTAVMLEALPGLRAPASLTFESVLRCLEEAPASDPVVRRLRALPELRAPSGLYGKIRSRFGREHRRRRGGRVRVLAALAAAALLVSALVRLRVESDPSSPPAPDPSPHHRFVFERAPSTAQPVWSLTLGAHKPQTTHFGGSR